MPKKGSYHVPTNEETGCCKAESLITVDGRGQMVLPKEIRDRAKIRPGDKLAIVSLEKDGEIYYIYLIKAEKIAEMCKSLLGPVMKEIISK